MQARAEDVLASCWVKHVDIALTKRDLHIMHFKTSLQCNLHIIIDGLLNPVYQESTSLQYSIANGSASFAC